MKNFIFLAIFSLFFQFLLADFDIPYNSDFSKIETPNNEIIFADEYQNEALKFTNIFQQVLENYNKSFSFDLDDEVLITFASSNDQIANAYSAQFPFNKMVLYGGGNSEVDYFSSSNWLVTVFLHEMAHNYQISAQKSKISKFSKTVFGHNFSLPFIPYYPFLTFPNVAVPTLLLEGDSVLNESRFGFGGRLYSGYSKALFFALLKDNKLNSTRLLNNHLEFPFLEEKYIIGGLFMQYLAQIYSVDKVNSFFYNFSGFILNPLRINAGFKEHFGKSFDDLISQFLNHYKNIAKFFKCLKSSENLKPILETERRYKLQNNKNSVFIFSGDAKSQPKLYKIDKQNGKLEFVKNQDYGNIFYDSENDKYLLSDSRYTADRKIHFALWNTDSNKLIKNSQGKYYLDLFKDKNQKNWIYFDMNNSFEKAKLYYNDKYYDTVDSEALFDYYGNLYYFKNENNINKTYIRKLYKNKKPIFEFQGFYSKVVDFDENSVYFISYSELGSSLYRFEEKSKKLYLVFEFDNITDAKIIDKNKILVNALTSENYKYFILDKKDYSEKEIKTLPFNQAFGEILNLDNSHINLNEISSKKFKKDDYNSISNLKFSKWNGELSSLYSVFNIYFADPVEFNSFALSVYLDDNMKSNISTLSYENNRYFGFRVSKYSYIKNAESFLSENIDNKWSINSYLILPILREYSRRAYFKIQGYTDIEHKENKPIILSLNYSNYQQYAYSYFTNYADFLNTSVRYARENILYKTTGFIQRDLPNEFYISGQIDGAYSHKLDSSKQQGIMLTSDAFNLAQDSTNIGFNSLEGDYRTKSIVKFNSRISKVFNVSQYFNILPVSIRREAIFYEYSRLYYNLGEFPKDKKIDEWSLGVTFDTLFFHKFAIPVTLQYTKNLFENNRQFSFSFGVEF